MQDRERVRKLLEKYKNGNCSSEEEAFLHAWFNQYAEREASGLNELERFYFQEPVVMPKKSSTRWVYWAAALFLLVAGAGIWQFSRNEQKAVPVVMTAVAPGGNRATLTLADGRQIALRTDQAGIVTGEDGILYGTGQNNLGPAITEAEVDASAELILTTPIGGTYQVVLSDGTKVWLNAGSKLRYPLRFNEKERMVTLEGEAYFAVQRKERPVAPGKPSSLVPFTVKTKDQSLEVLGTEFNLSAYGDETSVHTTLVEGKVRVAELTSGTTLVLQPGEQARNGQGKLTKGIVNTRQYTAWKDGDFFFDKTPLTVMMKQVARWYDIHVVYEKSPPQEVFSGVMSRNVSLQTLLELLTMSEVKYRLKGNKLTIL